MKSIRLITIILFTILLSINTNAQKSNIWQIELKNQPSFFKITVKEKDFIFQFNYDKDILSIGLKDNLPLPENSKISIINKKTNEEVFSSEMNVTNEKNHFLLNLNKVYSGLNDNIKKTVTVFVLKIISENKLITDLNFEFIK